MSSARSLERALPIRSACAGKRQRRLLPDHRPHRDQHDVWGVRAQPWPTVDGPR